MPSQDKQDSGSKAAKGAYSALSKKYSLPQFQYWVDEIDISHEDLDKAELPLREIMKKAADRLDWAAHSLESFIQPEQLAGFMEADAFSEKDKREILSIYRAVMKLYRKFQSGLLDSGEKENATLLAAFAKEWPAIKAGLKGIFGKVEGFWSKESAGQEYAGKFGAGSKAGYFG